MHMGLLSYRRWWVIVTEFVRSAMDNHRLRHDHVRNTLLELMSIFVHFSMPSSITAITLWREPTSKINSLNVIVHLKLSYLDNILK